MRIRCVRRCPRTRSGASPAEWLDWRVPRDDNVHTDRARAESFGSVAAQYDHYRPSYPDALIADLAELVPSRTLDVACGTGKVAVALVACGMSVLGVEVDPQMAAVHLEALAASGEFATIQTRRYRWHATLTADEWIGRLSTHSDHIRLPAEQRGA